MKPVFLTGNNNPFKIPGSSSTLFTTGKSLFNTSNLGNTYNPNAQVPKLSESKENDEEEDKLQEDIKEKVESNSMFEKLFQKQIIKIKILKGVGTADGQPSKKENGYLSIEKMK